MIMNKLKTFTNTKTGQLLCHALLASAILSALYIPNLPLRSFLAPAGMLLFSLQLIASKQAVDKSKQTENKISVKAFFLSLVIIIVFFTCVYYFNTDSSSFERFLAENKYDYKFIFIITVLILLPAKNIIMEDKS